MSKVLVVPNEAYDRFLPENFASLIAEAAKSGGFTHVVAAHGQFGKNTIPRVGAILDVQPIADIIDIEGEDTFVRQIYAGTSVPPVRKFNSHNFRKGMLWLPSSLATLLN